MRVLLPLAALVLFVAAASPAAAQDTSAAHPRHRSEELGAGIGLVSAGVVGGAFTALAFLTSEIRRLPPMCAEMGGCPSDLPVVGFDPNLVVLGGVLGAASLAAIVIGAVVFVAPALRLDDAPPPAIALSISPGGASASLTLRF